MEFISKGGYAEVFYDTHHKDIFRRMPCIDKSTHELDFTSFNDLIFKLLSLGYERTSVVRDKTEFAVRGSIIEIFIVDYEHPIRIDFFDNNIETIDKSEFQKKANDLKLKYRKILYT